MRACVRACVCVCVCVCVLNSICCDQWFTDTIEALFRHLNGIIMALFVDFADVLLKDLID